MSIFFGDDFLEKFAECDNFEKLIWVLADLVREILDQKEVTNNSGGPEIVNTEHVSSS